MSLKSQKELPKIIFCVILNKVMDKENKKLLKIVLVVAIVGGILWWVMKHNYLKEGLSHRLTTTSELLPLIYSTSMKESPYYQKWEYEVAVPNRSEPMIEGYSDMYSCEKACANVLGDTPRQDCIEYCQNQTLFANQIEHPSGCSANSPCPDGSVCTNPGFYNNGDGYCLATLEPGVPMPATLNPALRRLTPAWSPLTPGFAPLSPSLQPLDPAWAPLVPSMQPVLPPMRPLTPTMNRINPIVGKLTPAWGRIVPRPTPLTPAWQEIVPRTPLTQAWKEIIPGMASVTPTMANIVVKEKVGSQYAITSCPVGQFFDHNAQCCQPRLQTQDQ